MKNALQFFFIAYGKLLRVTCEYTNELVLKLIIARK